MRKVILIFIACIPFLIFSKDLKPSFLFVENKGQFYDQNNKSRTDVLFGATDGLLTFHFKRDGVSYQQYRADHFTEETDFASEKKHKIADLHTIYRIDIDWVNTDPSSLIEYGSISEDYNNYYFDVCPNGVNQVHSFSEITYRNLYKGIDLKWYEKEKHLKYDFIVSPGADYKKIQLRIKGAQELSINTKGELIITTPLGKITEEAPYVMQNGKSVKAFWEIKNKVVSFVIPVYDPKLPLLIDPGVRIWGTYYGGTGDDVGMGCATDNSGNVYMTGYSTSQGGLFIATSGSHQTTHGAGLENAFLAKFKSTGARLWATYYGGNARDIGWGCTTDMAGNVFLCGQTLTGTSNVIASGGHQNVHGGNWDSFLVKFNSNGVRQWGTYYGGNNEDAGHCCVADQLGNIYMTGKTKAQGNIIATPGAHQIASYGFEEAYLVKFNSNGVRVWGTFYGASDVDIGHGCAIDSQGNVYMAGHTNSTVNIASPGAHQTTHGFNGNAWDGFLAKFTSNGVRLWGTYYGGQGNDLGYSCAIDQQDNIYMCGKTDSYNTDNVLAIDGAHQTINGGGNSDAFLVKFNSTGVRLWGTLYGGGGEDCAYGCAVNKDGYVYISGYTSSSGGTSIATANSHQPVFGGFAYDAFLVLFNNNGNRQWGTYYGAGQTEIGRPCATDQFYNVYFSGVTDSYTTVDIATAGSHQSTYNGGFAEGFFVRFYDCTPPNSPSNATIPGNQSICEGTSATIGASGTGTIKWYTTPGSPTAIQNGSTYITPTLSAGTYSYYAEASTCTFNPVRTEITVTVNPLPFIFVSASKTLACPGESVALSSAGAASYFWSTGANTSGTIVNPTITTTYTVTGISPQGCSNTAAITVSMDVCSAIGIEENNENMNVVVVYPNPSDKYVTIDHLPATGHIRIYNTLGEMIFSTITDTASYRLNLSGYASGIYFIKIEASGAQKTVRLIRN